MIGYKRTRFPDDTRVSSGVLGYRSVRALFLVPRSSEAVSQLLTLRTTKPHGARLGCIPWERFRSAVIPDRPRTSSRGRTTQRFIVSQTMLRWEPVFLHFSVEMRMFVSSWRLLGFDSPRGYNKVRRTERCQPRATPWGICELCRVSAESATQDLNNISDGNQDSLAHIRIVMIRMDQITKHLFYGAPSGLIPYKFFIPRALPWADIFPPFGPYFLTSGTLKGTWMRDIFCCGLAGVRAEMSLLATSFNIKRVITLQEHVN